MRFTFTAVAVAITATAATLLVDARSAPNSLFGVARQSSHSVQSSFGRHNSLSLNSLATSVPRGGGDDSESEEADAEEEPLYLPGLLEASIPSKSSVSNKMPSASNDYTLTISPSKAKELKVSTGDTIAIIGKRRRASYAKVSVQKMKSGSVKMSNNLASNLRVRDTDKVKIVPLHDTVSSGGEENEHESYSLGDQPTAVAAAVTFSPVKDSLHSLELREGGDELSEEELSERFLLPYLNLEDGGEVILKEGHTLELKDENGLMLEFTVGHLDMVGDDEEGEGEVAEKGEASMCVCV